MKLYPSFMLSLFIAFILFNCKGKHVKNHSEAHGHNEASAIIDTMRSERMTNLTDYYSNIASKDIIISGIHLGDPVSKLEKILGNADSIVLSINEFNGDTSYRHHFKNSFFDVFESKLSEFHVVDSDFELQLNRKIRVGRGCKYPGIALSILF